MRDLKIFLAAGAASISMAVAITTPAFAQETTSSIRGTVTSDGAPIAGATVEIVNVPSGTRATTTTNESGAFIANGLRAGGPYTVSVAASGYQGTQITDIDTIVAQSFELPIELAAESAGEDIIVTASRLPGARSVSQGPATVLSSRQVENVASINHDIRDLVRRDPFARLDDTPSGGRSVSFAGQNARFNRFSVDGVPITDNFGLNPDGLPSRRSPIPLDAIGQFQAKVAPYDIREGNFQGGSINIVLKSGTNDFHGTGFYAYSADELTGNTTKAGPGVPTGKVTLPDFKIENYGVQLAGPIIKDKLFFMIAGERYRAGRPIAEGPTNNNAGIAIPTLTQEQVDNISSIAESRYSYDTGGVLDNNGDKDDRLVGRLDANLSDTQRFSMTGTYAKDTIAVTNNTVSSTTGPQLGLASNAYLLGNELYTGVAQLNSEWSDTFSTEARGFYKNYTRIQTPFSGLGFAQVRVCTAPTSDRTTPGGAANLSTNCPVGSSVVSFGPDTNRQANQLKTETYGGALQTRLTVNNHDLRILGEYSRTKVFNLFVPTVAGNYYFDSIADFQAGNAQSLAYGNAVPSLDPNDAAASFSYSYFTVGVQDSWRISDTLTLAYGIRYDTYGGDSTPAISPSFVQRYGYANNNYINGLEVFQPRFGFDYRPSSSLSVRGGFGIFAGGAPDVYVSNSFSNTGVLSNSVSFTQANDGTYRGNVASVPLSQIDGAAILRNVNGAVVPTAANNYLLAASGNVATNSASTSTTNALDPKFKIPSQWRGTLSIDWTPDTQFLGGGWTFGADAFYSGVRSQVYFTDIRSVPLAGSLLPDGRQRYAHITGSNSDTNTDILLTNTDLGRSYVGVARVRKDFDFGLTAGVSFTYQDIKDATPATSSTAGSNYTNGAFIDTNTVAYGTSNDEVKYNFKYDVTFDHAFFGDYKTTFALFGETRIGRPYSWAVIDRSLINGVARSAVFGAGSGNSRFLAYVPKVGADPLVSYANAAQQQQFESLITNSKLNKYQGRVAPRNAFNSKWFTRFDLHVAQELPTLVGKSRFTLFADIENVTNLINKNWGQIREYIFPYTNTLAEVQCLRVAVPTGTTPTAGQISQNSSQPCVQYRYLPPQQGATAITPATDTIYSNQSLYAVRVGVRVTF